MSAHVRPGDRVAIMLPQGLDYVTAFLACLFVRAIAVPLPAHGRQPARTARVLMDCAPAVVLADSLYGLGGLPAVRVGHRRRNGRVDGRAESGP
ncbi:AMP-binding protein [Streptomyces sp. NPDC059037]|uniref:AMP-binding protein n=1 Tax=Streptomyces sp. NPDC059037 TaxID=3346710 RepID=UPI003685CA3E